MGIEKKSQMEAEEAFKLDVVRVKLVIFGASFTESLRSSSHYRRASL